MLRLPRWSRHGLVAMLPLLALMNACQPDGGGITAPSESPSGEASPGLIPADFGASRSLSSTGPSFDAAATPTGGLNPAYTATGKVVLSVDGLDGSGTIQVQKPAGATVRAAFIAGAKTGNSSLTFARGDLRLEGQEFDWANRVGQGYFSNAWADVTTLVKEKIDGSPAGRVNITVTEIRNLEGFALAVVFDDASQAQNNTVVLMFGAQNSGGDNFYVALNQPVNPSLPGLVIDMGLGISYGFQGAGSYGQHSVVKVNDVLVSDRAGGQDDGFLITVGGLDDSNSNAAGPAGFRIDDELYDLKPFLAPNATLIHVSTRNPSNDDNIFFASFFMTVAGSVVVGDEPPPPPADQDGDGVSDSTDNCPAISSADQTDTDADGQGDACDADDDNDGIPDAADNAPLTPNSDQADTDGDGIGDVTDPDDDNDSVLDGVDNCPVVANADQLNTDGDALGDACDPDDDGDTVADAADNCPVLANTSQSDVDGDGKGDACDPNSAPVASLTGPESGLEGGALVFDASGSTDADAEQLAALTYAFVVNGGTVVEDRDGRITVTPKDQGVVTVEVTVTDPYGATSVATASSIIANVAPAGTFATTSDLLLEGQGFTLSFSDVTDPSSVDAAAGYTYAFNCGEGFGGFGTSPSVVCATTDEGLRQVAGRVRDKDGGERLYAGEVTVRNVAPVVSAGSDISIVSGQSVVLNASFTDPGADSPWTYTVHWGVGSPSAGSASAPGSVTGSRQFVTAGTYTVKVTVTDADGASDSDELTVTVTRASVVLDVKPGSSDNPINIKQKGVVPVAVLSTPSFDARGIDVATARLGTGGASESHGRGHPEDVDGDGDLDLLLHFDAQALGLTGGSTTLTLTATLADGRQVTGTDQIRIVP